MKVCKVCGALNDKLSGQCVNCGSSLTDNAPEGDGYIPTPVNQSEASVSSVYASAVTIPSETAKCPNCGANVPISAIFCDKCGADVSSLHDRRTVERKVCPHCGRINTVEAVYCSYCYYSLADAEAIELQVVHDSQNFGGTSIRQSYLANQERKGLICPNCGTLNAENDAFCVNCGVMLELEAPQKYCMNCGASNPQDADVCYKCNTSFADGTDDNGAKWECPNCGQANSVEDAFCTNCGTKKGK